LEIAIIYLKVGDAKSALLTRIVKEANPKADLETSGYILWRSGNNDLQNTEV
jgi:hypothetical protein